jgi:hypothetical protein
VTFYSHQHRLLFVAVPRTASHAVRDALHAKYPGTRKLKKFRAHMGKHALGVEICARMAPREWRQIRKVSVVRNPYERLVSLWLAQSEKNEVRRDRPEFNQWLMDAPRDFYMAPALCQWAWFHEGITVYRFERLDMLEDDLGIQLDPPPPRDYNWRRYYTPESERWVRTVCAQDFFAFGYSRKIDI